MRNITSMDAGICVKLYEDYQMKKVALATFFTL